MALLQPDKAIYHHPLNTVTEAIKSEPWTPSTEVFSSGKVLNALFRATGLNAFGTEAEFLSTGTATDIGAVMLSATKFVVVYQDGADSFHGTAKVGTVSGTDITFGAETEFLSTGLAGENSVVKLSATKFVVAYRDASDSNHGTAKVGTVSGTDITFGAETEFLSEGLVGDTSTSCCALNSTQFVVAYRDRADSSHGTAKVGTVSGTAITFGAETEFLSDGIFKVSAVLLSATSFVVVYNDNADSDHGTAKVGTVSGTDITFGAEAEWLSTGFADDFFAAALSETSFVVVYRDIPDSSHGTAKVGTVSGTAITFGAEAEFVSAGSASLNSVAKLSATSFVVVYQDGADSNHGTAKVGTVSGTDIAFGAEEEFLSAGAVSNSIFIVVFSAVSFVVAYQDFTDSRHGTARVGSIPTGASLTGSGASYDSVIGSTKLAYTGWLKNPSA